MIVATTSQMELGEPLDFNHELKTVGLSNFFSGLTGGQTGSYIFSQTLLTCRAVSTYTSAHGLAHGLACCISLIKCA